MNIRFSPFYLLSHWLHTPPDAPLISLLFHIISEVVAVALITLLLQALDTKEIDLAVATLELEAKVHEV